MACCVAPLADLAVTRVRLRPTFRAVEGFFGHRPSASRGPYLQGLAVVPRDEVLSVGLIRLRDPVDRRGRVDEPVPDESCKISPVVAGRRFFVRSALSPISCRTDVPTHAAFLRRAATIALNFSRAANCFAVGGAVILRLRARAGAPARFWRPLRVFALR